MSDLYANLDIPTLQTLRDTYRANLQTLVIQASAFGGAHVPLPLANQITETLKIIETVNSALSQRGIPSSDPAPNTPIAAVVSHYAGGEQGVIARDSTVRNISQERSDGANQHVEAHGSTVEGVIQSSGSKTSKETP
jgi:hypothetical protein